MLIFPAFLFCTLHGFAQTALFTFECSMQKKQKKKKF
jgi:hypothetical protein